MRPLVAPGQAAPRVTQLARGRRPAGAARGNEMHSQLPTLGSRRVGLGPRPSRRAIAGTHEAPSHVANVSTGGSDSGAHAQGQGGDATVSGTTLLVSIHGKLDYGLQMGISGDDKEFGDWKPERAYILKWTEGDVWTARVDLPSTVKEVEYKLLTTYKGKEFDWEDYENRTLDLTPGGGDAICRVSGEYGKALDVQITPRPAGMPAAPAAPGPDAAYTGGAAQRQRQGQHLNVNNITSQPAAAHSASPPGARFESAPGTAEGPSGYVGTDATPNSHANSTGKKTPGGISLDPPDFSKGTWRSTSSAGDASTTSSKPNGIGAFSQSFSERVERAREAARNENKMPRSAAGAGWGQDGLSQGSQLLRADEGRPAEWNAEADVPSSSSTGVQSELSQAAEQASQGFAAAFGFETRAPEPVPVNAGYDSYSYGGYDGGTLNAGVKQAVAAYESYEDIRKRQSTRSPSYDDNEGDSSYSSFNDRVSKTLERLTGLSAANGRGEDASSGGFEAGGGDHGVGSSRDARPRDSPVDSWQSAPPSTANSNGWNQQSSGRGERNEPNRSNGDYQPAYVVPSGTQREASQPSGRSSSDWYTEPAAATASTNGWDGGTNSWNGGGQSQAATGYSQGATGYSQAATATTQVDTYSSSKQTSYNDAYATPPRLSNSVQLLPDGACRDLAVADDAASTWLEKLEVVSRMIGASNEVTVDKIAVCVVYIKWLGTCDVDCAEDDGRRGPNAACDVAREIFTNLEQTAGELYKRGTRVGEVERALMRQIQPWLPSFADEFARGGAPMARIRNITSMPEVPEPLREEIRVSIEDKLARNAGPVALYATEAMLKTIKEDAYPGQYPQRFVDEFVAFMQELKRYFNCAGALDRLYAMEALDDDQKLMVDELRDAMSQLSRSASATTTAGSGLTTPEGAAVLRALRATTAVRGYFTSLLSTALRDSNSNQAAMTTRQQWRMAEVSLEELGFVLLTRTLFCAGFVGDDDEGQGEFERSLSYDPAVWTAACNCVSQGLRHVALSMWRPMECHAVARELEAWCSEPSGPIGTPENALRMRAALERALRLLRAHTEAVTRAYGESPALLGTALNVPSYVSDAFADTAIRGGLPFQLSRLVDPMRAAASVAAGAGEGSKKSIVLGKGVGRLVECDRLTPGSCGSEADGPVVAFVWNVDGSEEVTCAGRHVRGIIAARALNPTSHLAVRARQEGVPLTATPSAKGATNAARAARELMGDWVQLTVNDGGVLLGRASAQERDDAKRESSDWTSKALTLSSSLTPRLVSSGVECVRLAEAVAERAGRKAATCGDLTRVASRPGSGFTALDGVAVPFGAMELQIRERGVWSEFQNAIGAVDAATRRGSLPDLERACDVVRSLITQCGCPLDVAATICAGLGEGSSSVLGTGLLAIRSSSNVEDPAQMSGCGGHVSVVGVHSNSATAVADAVCEVWASLFTPEAVLSRTAAGGTSSAEAHMAVFAQEMAPASLSFVLHTGGRIESCQSLNPGTIPDPKLEVELAVGLGEALARSGTESKGTPWRLEVDLTTGDVETTAFGGVGMARVYHQHLGLRDEAVDYSKQALSLDVGFREKLGRRLAAVGAALEAEFGSPQNVEGCVVGDDVYVFQSRPQPL